MNINAAKFHFNSDLSKQSAKADGNKTAEELIILPFTLVNGFVNSAVQGVLTQIWNLYPYQQSA